MRYFLPTLILPFLVVAAVQGDDYEEAYRLRARQEILPLGELLRRLNLGADTRILEIESEFEHGRRIYEIEYLTANGRVREVIIDARNGEVLADEEED